MLSKDWLAFYHNLAQQNLTIVDLETTGYSPPQARVTEISVIHANLQQGIQDQATTLINSQTVIPENIVRLTGITQAMLDQAPPADRIWSNYAPLLTSGILTCHNVEFDYPFLQAELKNCQINFQKPPQERFCTVIFSRQMLPDLRSRSLPDLVHHFGFSVGRSHRAEADAIACWYLAERLLTEVMQERDEILLQRFARQWLPLSEAAQILGQSPAHTRKILETAQIKSRNSKRRSTSLYQRGEVEKIFYQQALQDSDRNATQPDHHQKTDGTNSNSNNPTNVKYQDEQLSLFLH
jgi:DNA polymerase III subunit epsilon